VYGWIWRHIPFKQWQLKALVSAVLAGAVAALLWYQVFPAVEPLLPFDDVQVETDDQNGGQLEPPPSSAPSSPSSLPSKVPSKAPSSKAPQVLPS
jgi:hypothetical protein